MNRADDTTVMVALLLIVIFLLAVGPLALVAGADSRFDEVGRRRSGR